MTSHAICDDARWSGLSKRRQVLSAIGEVQFRRGYGFCPHCGEHFCPADAALGLATRAPASPRVQGICALMALAYRSREVVAKGYAEEVAVRCDGREIARHARSFRKGELVLNPLHYLPALRRKPHELDHAAAFRGWTVPLVYERFRRELEKRSDEGLRQYVEIVSLLGQFPQSEVTAALRRAVTCQSFSVEAVRFYATSSKSKSKITITRGVTPSEPPCAPQLAPRRQEPSDRLRYWP